MFTTYQQEVLKALLDGNNALSNETVDVTNGSISQLAVPQYANYCLITVEGGGASDDGIRFWLDGSNPTATEGILRKDGSGFDIKSANNMVRFKAYGVGTNDCVLQVQYYK